jgi:hypothetical protein
MTMESMTIQQIADLCGVAESTVRTWIDKAAASAEIAKPSAEIAKVSNEPFRFTLPETLAIIRAGGKSTLADLLEDNAGRKETALALRDSVQALVPQITAAVMQAMRAPDRLSLPAPEIPQDYYTIKMYAALRGMWVGNSTAVTFGRHAAELSRIQGKEVKRIPVPGSEIRQEVSAFHISILQEVFTL